MWFKCATQLGTSQGVTATTSARGPSNGGALVPGPLKRPQQRGKVALQGICTPPRGTLPVWAKMCKELGRHRNTGEAEGRGVGQLVKEVTSREDLSENVKGCTGRSAEGTGDETHAFVEHKLGTRAKGTVLAGGGPELAAIG